MTIPVWAVRLLNPLVGALLRSPLHGLLSRDIMLITFPGRKTGRLYTTPVSYVRDGSRVRCFTESPWSRNFRGGIDVTVRVAGEDLRGRARPIEGDPDRVVPAVDDFFRRVPRDAPYVDIALGPDGAPDPADVRRAAERMILIEIDVGDSARR